MRTKLCISKAVIQKDGRYLLLKRASDAKAYPDLWDFPGGRDEPGETPAESVIRETDEETRLQIVPGEAIKTGEHEDDLCAFQVHFFSPTTFEGDIELSNDHSEYLWVSDEEISSLETHPAVRLFFR